MKIELVRLSNQIFQECNGERVEIAKIGILYLLPFVVGVLICEVCAFSFLGGRGI